jgi:hypothetical protein
LILSHSWYFGYTGLAAIADTLQAVRKNITQFGQIYQDWICQLDTSCFGGSIMHDLIFHYIVDGDQSSEYYQSNR